MPEGLQIEYARNTATPSLPWWLSLAGALSLGIGVLYTGMGVWTVVQDIRGGAVSGGVPESLVGLVAGIPLIIVEYRLLVHRCLRSCRMGGLLWLGLAGMLVMSMMALPPNLPWQAWIVPAAWLLVCVVLGVVHLGYALRQSRRAAAGISEV